MIQKKMGEIFIANKSKKENLVTDCYYQNALGLLSDAIFSPEHTEQGVTDEYVKSFCSQLRSYAEELQSLARRQRQLEERLHYMPSRDNMFKLPAAANKTNSLTPKDESDDLYNNSFRKV